jgi:hypothetical protein
MTMRKSARFACNLEMNLAMCDLWRAVRGAGK